MTTLTKVKLKKSNKRILSNKEWLHIRFYTEYYLRAKINTCVCGVTGSASARRWRGDVFNSRHNSYHAQLGYPDKGRAIKGLVVYNSWNLEPWDLLKGLALGCYQPSS